MAANTPHQGEQTINGYPFESRRGIKHNSSDVRRVINATEETWTEMANAMLPKTIREELEKKHKRQFKYGECETTHGSFAMHKTTQYQGLPGLRKWHFMHSYEFYRIPDFCVSFSRNVPAQRLPHEYNIYSFLGGNLHSLPQANVDGIHVTGTRSTISKPWAAPPDPDSFSENARKRFGKLEVRRDQNYDRFGFKGDGRGTSPYRSQISLDFHDHERTDTIHVTFFPEDIGTPDFMKADVQCKPVPFSRWEKFFPFYLDQQKLKNDPQYQRQVYYRLQYIIVLGEDPGPREARHFASTMNQSR